jgi:arylsulfatase A-like enzyme
MDARGKAIPFVAQISRPGSHAALLDWPYKLHTDASAGRAKKAAADPSLAPVLLYDVSKDPNETTDLAAQQPERVAKMKAELTAWKASVEKSLAGGDYGGQPTSEPAPKSKKEIKKANKRQAAL